MNVSRGVTFIESSFLSKILENKDITDISYNGKSIYYEDLNTGRHKSDISPSLEVVKDFIRQLANISEKQFSYSEPILDITVGKYRFNAVHHSICKSSSEETYTFSLRIASETIRIKNDGEFFPDTIYSLLVELLKNNISIVIGGLTGSGKTEFQKYLISLLEENTRAIIIDNILELVNIKDFDHLDVNVWQANEKQNHASISALVKNALRSNPDWLIVAETRGEEANELLSSVLSGHPIITTLHSLDSFSIPTRLTRMIMMADKRSDYKEILNDVFYHLHVYFYISKYRDKNHKIVRYVKEVSVSDFSNNIVKIYEVSKDKLTYRKIPKDLEFLFENSDKNSLFYKTFIGK